MVDLDLRVGTEVLMPRRSLWSRETTLDCREHHEAGTIRRRKDYGGQVAPPHPTALHQNPRFAA